MAEIGIDVQVVELIRSPRDLTIRFHANKVFTQKVFPLETTVIFKDGRLTADRDELQIEEEPA